MLATISTAIRFATYKLLAATDGNLFTHHLETNIIQEDNGQWRATEERVISSEVIKVSEI